MSTLDPKQLQMLLASALAAATQKSSTDESGEEWLTLKEAEQRYKISRWTIRRLRIAGKIIAKKLSKAKSGKVLISKKSMELWLNTTGDFIGEQA